MLGTRKVWEGLGYPPSFIIATHLIVSLLLTIKIKHHCWRPPIQPINRSIPQWGTLVNHTSHSRKRREKEQINKRWKFYIRKRGEESINNQNQCSEYSIKKAKIVVLNFLNERYHKGYWLYNWVAKSKFCCRLEKILWSISL